MESRWVVVALLASAATGLLHKDPEQTEDGEDVAFENDTYVRSLFKNEEDAPVRPAPPAGTPQRALLSMPRGQRLQSVLPIAWVHVPKCGSSFGNTLIDMPGMCPNIPKSEYINKEEYGEMELGGFKKRWDILGHGCGLDKFAKWGNHAGMGNEEPRPRDFFFAHRDTEVLTGGLYSQMYKGHAMGFFRQPEQRIISGFHHGYHDYPRGKNAIIEPNMKMYRHRVKGCAVKMLSRQGGFSYKNSVCGGPLPTEREVQRAIVRLREAFVFVGITDWWQASICTFHKMFGGKCRKTDFKDNRVGAEANTKHVYSVEDNGLAGFHDIFDGRLYEEAKKVALAQMDLFNVTQESCRRCLGEAGASLNKEEWPLALGGESPFAPPPMRAVQAKGKKWWL